jgi:hypothetical protein
VAAKPDRSKLAPEAELQSYIHRLDPKDQKLMLSVRAAVRKRFPTAHELAYDYSSHVVIAYSSTDRAVDSILAIDGRAAPALLYRRHPCRRLPTQSSVGWAFNSGAGHPALSADCRRTG